jgi:electron transport complex protein RnfG
MSAARIILVLTIIGVISGAALSVVFGFVNPQIQENRRVATNEAVKNVVPGAVKVESEKRDGETIFKGMDKDGRLLGYAFTAEFSGFQGKITAMIGMDTGFKKVTGLDILENVETPGLGQKVSSESWQDQFKGLNGAKEIMVVKYQTPDKSRNEVEAVTGATISSKSVVKGVNERISQIREAVGKQ